MATKKKSRQGANPIFITGQVALFVADAISTVIGQWSLDEIAAKYSGEQVTNRTIGQFKGDLKMMHQRLMLFGELMTGPMSKNKYSDQQITELRDRALSAMPQANPPRTGERE